MSSWVPVQCVLRCGVVIVVNDPAIPLELQNQCGPTIFSLPAIRLSLFPPAVTNGGLLQRTMFLPPTSQPQKCTPCFGPDRHRQHIQRHYRCQHNGLELDILVYTHQYSQHYATVTPPLKPLARCQYRSMGCTWRARFCNNVDDKKMAESGSLADSAIPIRLSRRLLYREPPERLVGLRPSSTSIWAWELQTSPCSKILSERLARGSQAIGSAKRSGRLRHLGQARPLLPLFALGGSTWT